MSKAYKSWDGKGAAAQKLIEQFSLYKSTKGAAGVNYNLNKPKDILNEVYNTQSYLQTYNPTYFSNANFRKLRNNWLTSQEKNEGRKEEEQQTTVGKIFYFNFQFVIRSFLHPSSHKILFQPNKRRIPTKEEKNCR